VGVDSCARRLKMIVSASSLLSLLCFGGRYFPLQDSDASLFFVGPFADDVGFTKGTPEDDAIS